ncbi:MAG: hypothetical protein EOM37_08705 [Proteobacteria bacterium]|jgi:hypothetical protein|nr:hypothetical protein [Alphaproteobacteria bacterium]NCC04107.1 hypothetical protein [Pseudomonadota bacterium]
MRKNVVKGAVLAVIVLLGLGLSAPARAGTAVSVTWTDGDRHYDRGRSRDFYHRDRHHWRPAYHPRPRRIVHVYPVRPIVYESSYIVPTMPVSAPIVVNPSSPTYYNGYGQMCREYQSSAWVGGAQRQTYGTACLQPDGSWRVAD